MVSSAAADPKCSSLSVEPRDHREGKATMKARSFQCTVN
jgi:hypothetical protein